MPGKSRPIEQAAEFLRTSSASPKEKLVVGVKLLQAATMFSEDWPPELLNRAREICHAFLKNRSVAAWIRRMDEAAIGRRLTQLTQDVAELAADLEKAGRQ
jgi:hypothetical protein